MKLQTNRGAVLILAIISLWFSAVAHCGVIADVKFYMANRSDINAHTKNMAVAVKELYRDRESVSQFTKSAAVLINAYRGVQNNKPNIPKLLEIASSIDNLIKEYNKLTPTCERLYNQVKPDLKYFSGLAEDVNASDNTNPSFLKKTLTDSRLSKIAGSAGWGRVWDSVKSNPSNLFRWGKLKDEYQYGKTEASYILKTAQIAYEGATLYQEAQKSVQSLLGIKAQISKLMSGDLSAILGLPNTVNAVQNSATSVNDLGLIVNQGVSLMGKRFDELQKLQNDYLANHKAYQEKYGNAQTASAKAAQTTSQTGTTKPWASATSTSGANLQVASDLYQKAYRKYVEATSNPNISDRERQAVMDNLRQARSQMDAARGAAGQ